MSDWFGVLEADAAPDPELGALLPFDVVTANPPYISAVDWPTLPPTVRLYVPSAGGPRAVAVVTSWRRRGSG